MHQHIILNELEYLVNYINNGNFNVVDCLLFGNLNWLDYQTKNYLVKDLQQSK